MEILFAKYHGTGNDFILIDNRQNTFPKSDNALIAKMCQRHFGIGADGLILLETDTTADFKMLYYNADGRQSSMCGNGGRCIVHFANALGLCTTHTTFNAVDGLHHAKIQDDLISLKMNDVTNIKHGSNYLFLDTGSPHHVTWVDDVDLVDVLNEGKALRHNLYKPEGANINFVSKHKHLYKVRTYERGVEDETLSCGTGVTAVAIALHIKNKLESPVKLQTKGGMLSVQFSLKNNSYTNIWLIGPAQQVYKGIWK